jgi:hypothetical protein
LQYVFPSFSTVSATATFVEHASHFFCPTAGGVVSRAGAAFVEVADEPHPTTPIASTRIGRRNFMAAFKYESQAKLVSRMLGFDDRFVDNSLDTLRLTNEFEN